MLNDQNLADELQGHIVRLLADGTVDREQVRVWVVGLNPNADTLLLWAKEEWDTDYFDGKTDNALAGIAVTDWLDQADALELEVPEAPITDLAEVEPEGQTYRLDKPGYSASLAKLREGWRGTVQDALRALAVREPCVSLPKLCGLFEYGFNPLSRGNLDLVAFCHPYGAQPLWAVADKRADFHSCYHWAALVPEGIVSFFPEGEKVGFDDEELEPCVHVYRFDDMTMAHEASHYAIAFRLRGELEDREYQHGHTREKYGGKSRDETDDALRQHIRSRPELYFDPERFPKLNDTAAVARWLGLYRSTGQSGGTDVVSNLVREQGLDAARVFINTQPDDDASRGETLAKWAGKLNTHGHHDECLQVCAGLSGEARGRAGRHELSALAALDRWAEVAGRYEEIVQHAPDKQPDLAPWLAVALTHAGQHAQAFKLLEPQLKEMEKARDRPDVLLALAHARYADDREQAVALLTRAIAAGKPGLEVHAAALFAAMPALATILRERAQLLADWEKIGHALKEKLVRVTVPRLPLPGPRRPQAGEAAWSLTQSAEVESEHHVQGFVPLGDHVYMAEQTGGLRVFGADPSRGTLAHVPSENETSYEALTTDGKYLYAACYRTGLAVIDPADPLAPKVIAQSQPWVDEHYDKIAVGNGITVLGNWRLDVFDVRDPAAPRRITAIGAGDPVMDSSSYECMEFVGERLYLVSSQYGLLIMNFSEPARPQLESALAIEGEWSSDRLAIVGTLALISSRRGEGTWVIDIANPAAPRSVGVLPIVWIARPLMRDGALLIFDQDGRAWSLDLSVPDQPRVLSVRARVGAEGRDSDVRDASDMLAVGEDVVILNDKKLLRLHLGPDPRPDYAAERAALQRFREPLRAWCEARMETLAAEHPGFRAGAVVLEWWGENLVLNLDVPRSLSGFEKGPVDKEHFHRFEVQVDELQPASSQAPESCDNRCEHTLDKARAETLRAVLEQLAASEALARIASGRVYLVLRDEHGLGVVKVRLDATRPWQPWRSALANKSPPTVEEMLGKWDAWKHRDTLVRQAREDDVARATVLRLAAEGNEEAQVVLTEIGDDYPDQVVPALLQAAGGTDIDQRVIEFLADYPDHAGVTETLERLYAHGSNSDRIQTAIALQRADSDDMVRLARMLLMNKNDQAIAELVIELLQAMTTRLPELRSDLANWTERSGKDSHFLAEMAQLLFRAGHRELPKAVQAQCRPEKSGEQHHDETLFGGWTQHRACQAERLWTGWLLAERVHAMRAAGDNASPIWPPSLPPEPYPASWGYVLAAARPHLESAGDWDWMVERVAEHLQHDPRFAAERRYALQLFEAACKDKNNTLSLRLGKAILAAPAGTFEPDALRRVERLFFYERIMEGWAHLKARELTEARRIANELFTQQPNEGQLLFFDARLTWLEESIPRTMEKVEKYLRQISDNDRPGRGRLQNLYGCALDELQRTAEALPWFEKAAQSHPEDAKMYFANLAEGHEKLGNAEQSRHYAQLARDKGSESAVVARILSGMEE